MTHLQENAVLFGHPVYDNILIIIVGDKSFKKYKINTLCSTLSHYCNSKFMHDYSNGPLQCHYYTLIIYLLKLFDKLLDAFMPICM
jgi:hypothetical protein